MKTSLYILLLFTSLRLIGQEGTLSGVIYNVDSTEQMTGVNIKLIGSEKGTWSLKDGSYYLSNIPAGKHLINFTNVGYYSVSKEIEIKENQVTKLDIILIENIGSLPEFSINWDRGLKDVPGSATYISPKEIAKFNYTDINKTLRNVAGINVQEEDGFGLRPNIGLRGTGVERSSKITIMEDEVLMAPAPYAAPAAYYFPTVGRMQGIEVLKGSSQIKYGPYTTGGAINFISTQIPTEFNGQVNLIGSSFKGRNVHAHVGNTHKNIAYLVETFQYSSDGFKTLANGKSTGFDKADYLAKLRFHTKTSAKIKQSITFKISQTTENSNETYLGLTEEDYAINPYQRYLGSQMDNMQAQQSQKTATHIVKFSSNMALTTTAYRTDFHRNWYKLDKVKDSSGTKIKIGAILENPIENKNAFDLIRGNSSLNNASLFVKANNRTYYSQGIQSKLAYTFQTKKVKHYLNFGIRYHTDEIDRFQWTDTYKMQDSTMLLTAPGTHGTESNRIETATALATYLQYKIKVGKITFTPGLRFEDIQLHRKDYGKTDPERIGTSLSERSNIAQVTIPGIGVDYKFSKYLSIFVGVHKGFAPPGTKRGTLPEESINSELGMRYLHNSLSGELIIYHNKYQNLLGSDLASVGGNGTSDLFNAGQVEAKGIESSIKYNVLAKSTYKFALPISLVYTYTDATFLNTFESSFEGWGDVTAGDQFPYLSNHQLSINLGYEYKKLNINISARYASEMRTKPSSGTLEFNQKIPSSFITDASVNYAIHSNIKLFGSVTNLLNTPYIVARRPAGLRPGMPRAFNLGLKAKF